MFIRTGFGLSGTVGADENLGTRQSMPGDGARVFLGEGTMRPARIGVNPMIGFRY
jgi:hypothetical protein